MSIFGEFKYLCAFNRLAWTTKSTLWEYLDFDSSNDNLDEEDKEEGEISSDEDEAISSNESKGETAAPVKLVDYESISSEDD